MNVRLVGLGILAAGAATGGWLLLTSSGNPFDELVGEVTTRHSGGDATREPRASRAQQLQLLEKDAARLESRIASERDSIEAEYERKRASETFDGVLDRTRRECEPVFGFNPWGSCDDRVLEQVKAENAAWRVEQINRRVRPLERELAEVEAERQSLLITA